MEQIRVEKTASRGIVVEKVYMYLEPDLTPATGTIADDQVQAEIEKFEMAAFPKSISTSGAGFPGATGTAWISS